MKTSTVIKVAEMSKDITYIKESLSNNKEEHEAIMVAIKNLDKRFADKRTEYIVYGLCALILVAFIKSLL